MNTHTLSLPSCLCVCVCVSLPLVCAFSLFCQVVVNVRQWCSELHCESGQSQLNNIWGLMELTSQHSWGLKWCVCVCVFLHMCKEYPLIDSEGFGTGLMFDCWSIRHSSIQPIVFHPPLLVGFCPLAPVIPFDEALLWETVCGTNQKLESGEPPNVITSANGISTIDDDSPIILNLWKCFGKFWNSFPTYLMNVLSWWTIKWPKFCFCGLSVMYREEARQVWAFSEE